MLKRILGRLQIESDYYFKSDYYKEIPFYGYTKIIDKEEITIYRANELKEQIIAAFNSVVVTQYIHLKKQILFLYPNYSKKYLRYKIKFNEKIFPGLIKGSRIMNCLLIPYMREVTPDRYYKRWRLVVFTDKCQVYHNFPVRSCEADGFEEFGDIVRFEESVVWDIPRRRYPSDRKKCEISEFYFPFLPKECYEYHPAVGQFSKYGNDGFKKYTEVETENGKEIVSRFYFPIRSLETNPFFYMGGIELDYKMSLIGTYQSNKNAGTRTAIFASSDGGRSWFAKYEFSDEGEYEFRQGSDDWGENFGNQIVYCENRRICIEARLRKRSLLHEKNNDSILWLEPIEIDEVLLGKETIVKTKYPHKLSTGNIIVIEKVSNTTMDRIEDLLCECYSNKYYNKLYKVEVVDSMKVKLYEAVSNPFVPYACRHIHHINRVRDGWVVGTGEIYPNGWIIYIQMKEADTFSRKKASDYLKIYFLTSSSDAVQRTLGMDIIDGEDPKIIFASDHDMLERKPFISVRGETICRNSTGIYYGDLKNINDFSSFHTVFEAKEPAYLFKKLDGIYLFSGQRGEIALSSDLKKWVSFTIDQPLIHYRGKTFRFYVFDKYIIEIHGRKNE